MENGNSGNYFGINAVSQLNPVKENKKFEPELVKIYYRYYWNINGFSIEPKIFTLIDISDESDRSEFYPEKQYIESVLFKK